MDLTELFRFALAVVLMPITFTIGRRIAIPRAHLPFLVGYVALVAAFGFRWIQTTPLRADEFRALVHIGYTLGGAGFAWAAWELRRHVLRAEGA